MSADLPLSVSNSKFQLGMLLCNDVILVLSHSWRGAGHKLCFLNKTKLNSPSPKLIQMSTEQKSPE